MDSSNAKRSSDESSDHQPPTRRRLEQDEDVVIVAVENAPETQETVEVEACDEDVPDGACNDCHDEEDGAARNWGWPADDGGIENVPMYSCRLDDVWTLTLTM